LLSKSARCVSDLAIRGAGAFIRISFVVPK
jgi:hypothetical protein